MWEKRNMNENKQKKPGEREKCFVMMPISDQGDYPKGHFQKVYEQIFQPAIEDAGYEAYRVDENAISDRIIDKIFNAIQDCPMALCDLSNRNPNVLYELGLRQAYDKPVVLVQDEKTEKIFDVSGISTVFYKSDRVFENVIDARKRISKAILDTREGKRNSIVRIVKSKSADYDSVVVSEDDKTQILFSEIMQNLTDIKEAVELKTTKSSSADVGKDFTISQPMIWEDLNSKDYDILAKAMEAQARLLGKRGKNKKET